MTNDYVEGWVKIIWGLILSSLGNVPANEFFGFRR